LTFAECGRAALESMAQITHRQALPKGYMLQEYQIDRVLGAGGFGLTYLGWDTALEKPVAVKEYLPNDLAVREANHSVAAKSRDDEDNFRWGLTRFLDEARTLARFKHPNIVSVYRYFEAHGTAYIVMEFVEGETFGAYLKRAGKPKESFLRAVLLALLDGLAEVHRAGFMHRDIKPGNILLNAKGVPVLVDFGSARQEIGGRSRSITSVVTPGYAPIEQYSSRGNQGPWTDIYALGAVAYRAITGEAPPDATERVRKDPMTPATEAARGKYSAKLLAAVDWALAVDEENRPQEVLTWLQALTDEVQTDKPVTAEPPAKPAVKPEVKRKVEGKRSSGWGWAVVVVGILVLLVVALDDLRQQEAEMARQEAASAEAYEQRVREAAALAEKFLQRNEERRAQARAEAINALDALKDRIAAAVEYNWWRPVDSLFGLTALIRVRVKRDGTVTFARVVESSGDRSFDDSAIIAVHRASPLPFPDNLNYYKFIKEFHFRFAPDDG